MIDSVFSYKILENETIIFSGENSIGVSNDIFEAKSNKLRSRIESQLVNTFSVNINPRTNIIYKITNSANVSITKSHLNEVNNITKGNKYIKRIAKLIELGYEIDFDSYEDDKFRLNLQAIDSYLPEIIAHIVLDKYTSRITKMTDIIEKIRMDNPMNYDLSKGHKFYEYKLVNFLVEAALGMTSKSDWLGKYDVLDGIIIVKPNAQIQRYHQIDFNKFRQYLKNFSTLDNPSGSKMGYGEVYRKDGKSFIKLNFQIKT